MHDKSSVASEDLYLKIKQLLELVVNEEQYSKGVYTSDKKSRLEKHQSSMLEKGGVEKFLNDVKIINKKWGYWKEELQDTFTWRDEIDPKHKNYWKNDPNHPLYKKK